jgi:monofunctional biosynthetic peptidoglycan transglycosylase
MERNTNTRASAASITDRGGVAPPQPRWTQLPQSWRTVAQLTADAPRVTSFMRYRAAQQRAPAPDPIQWTPLAEVSPYLLCTVTEAEDPRFFQHRGIWWGQLLSAVIVAYRHKQSVSGVSTITQQLARNLFLHPERSMRRKVQEAMLARRIEHVLPKRRILELYLNVVEWGEGIWGIAAAAEEYFRRSPAALDPFQAVVLATLLPAPRAAMRGHHAERAIRHQRRLMFPLYACGYQSLDEERETLARIARLEAELRAGTPLRVICRELAAVPYDCAAEARRAISVEEVLANEGNYAAQRSFMQYLGTTTPSAELLAARPMWWSTGCANAPPATGAATR